MANWKPLAAAVLLFSLPWPAIGFEFIVIGDTRPKFESESFRPFQTLISKINALRPALVINLGDLIYGYGVPSKETQWDKYEAVVRTIRSSYYQVPGNHDTHSRRARRVYGKRFGKFYQSFDYGDCHFVLLDTTEGQHWGLIGAAQLEWLKRDLKQTQARAVFVFTHFPIWEPERITPEYYDFWAKTLHPLFKASRVKAVFAGHYHTYGPTRQFDGIYYFITGGGGAELRPEYRKSGGEYHFMKVTVADEDLRVRVVTDRGELSDPEADVMGGLQFAARNVSRIGILRGKQDLHSGVTFDVAVANPYHDVLTGEAQWIVDASAFAVEPSSFSLHIPVGATRRYSFTLKSLQPVSSLGNLPRLQFTAAASGRIHRFHREVRVLESAITPFVTKVPAGEPRAPAWTSMPTLHLGDNFRGSARFASCFDEQHLYLSLTIPASEMEEAKEIGFTDELQVGLARRSSNTDFGSDFLRLGFSANSAHALNRTPGRRAETVVPGVKVVSSMNGSNKVFQIAIPWRLLKHGRSTAPSLVVDISFPVPDGGGPEESADPPVNSLSYRIRYGSDSLVPVYFVALELQHKGP